MTLVAGIWVKSLTGSNSAAALVSVCVYAPSLLGPLAGLIADRVPLRTLLVIANLGAGVLVLPLLAVRSSRDVWLIYVVMAIYGLSAVLIDPAESALFTVIFSDEMRPRINGLRITLQESGKLVAPLAGASLFAAFGGGLVAALDAVTFLIAAIAVLRLRFPLALAREVTPTGWRRDIAAAVIHLRQTPELRRIVALAAGAMALSGVLVAAQYGLVTALHKPPSFLGVLTAALGAGSIVAGLVSGRLIARFGERPVLLIGLINAATGSLLQATGLVVPALVGSFVLGFALPWIVVAAITTSQRLTPQALQGRMAAALTLALFAPLPATNAIGAGLISRLDYRSLYISAAALEVAVVVLVLVNGRSRHGDKPNHHVHVDRSGSLKTRAAKSSDIADLLPLFEQWGHPQTEEQAQVVLAMWSAAPFSEILLVEDRGQVAGMAAVSAYPRFADLGRNAILAGLVVGADYRRNGIGRRLLTAAETLAREWGCTRLELTSSRSRSAAHEFYRALGYQETSEQQARFVRPLKNPVLNDN